MKSPFLQNLNELPGPVWLFGISTNDKEERAWNDELQTLMNEAQDDDFLVVVDCHI